MYTAGRKFYKDSLEKSTYFLAENFYDYFYFLDFNLPLQVIIGEGGEGRGKAFHVKNFGY